MGTAGAASTGAVNNVFNAVNYEATNVNSTSSETVDILNAIVASINAQENTCASPRGRERQLAPLHLFCPAPHWPRVAPRGDGHWAINRMLFNSRPYRPDCATLRIAIVLMRTNSCRHTTQRRPRIWRPFLVVFTETTRESKRRADRV
jgi:hypothetical protein